MGNTCSSCCCGSQLNQHQMSLLSCTLTSIWFRLEKSKSGLYEPLLQENEREAITELLHFLESKVQQLSQLPPHTHTLNRSQQHKLLWGRASSCALYASNFRQCRFTEISCLGLCRDNRKRYIFAKALHHLHESQPAYYIQMWDKWDAKRWIPFYCCFNRTMLKYKELPALPSVI